MDTKFIKLPVLYYNDETVEKEKFIEMMGNNEKLTVEDFDKEEAFFFQIDAISPNRSLLENCSNVITGCTSFCIPMPPEKLIELVLKTFS